MWILTASIHIWPSCSDPVAVRPCPHSPTGTLCPARRQYLCMGCCRSDASTRLPGSILGLRLSDFIAWLHGRLYLVFYAHALPGITKIKNENKQKTTCQQQTPGEKKTCSQRGGPDDTGGVYVFPPVQTLFFVPITINKLFFLSGKGTSNPPPI